MAPEDTDEFYFHETLDPHLADVQQRKFITPEEALRELIDNSFDAQVSSTVRVDAVIRKNFLAIEDSGGSGMGKTDLLERWSHWGSSGKDEAAINILGSKGFLGRDGVGGKAAVEYLTAGTYTLTCSKLGEYHEYVIQPTSSGRRHSLREFHGQETDYPRPLPGRVKIEINGTTVNFSPGRLEKYLGKTYAIAIEQRSLNIRINEKEIQPMKPAYESEPNYSRFILSNGTVVETEMGLTAPDHQSEFEPGLQVYVLGRLIKEGWMAGWPDINKKPELRRLMGRINITTGNIGLSITKSDFLQTQEWLEVQQGAYEALRPLVKKLEEDAETKRLPRGERQAYEVADRIARMVAPAPEDRTYGRKRAERQDITEGGSRHQPKEGSPRLYIPKTPAPSEAVGKRERLGRSYFVERKAMELGRLTMFNVEQFTNEDGEINWRLLIGKNYIFYERARSIGHLTEHLLLVYAAGIARVKAIQGEVSKEKEAETAYQYWAQFLEAARKSGFLKKSN